ncbi:MAG TPA: hypothetical protein VFX77_04980 [Rubrobacter sp.]|nr:hypothetical protein [Rubrobacter sp.]
MEHLIDALFDLSPQVRYVAIYRHGELSLRQRHDLSLASAAESDRYEELLVNPTVLTLTRQRGDIDCGGLSYVVIRYGNFFQFVAPIESGHASVAFEPDADPIGHAQEVLSTIERHLT